MIRGIARRLLSDRERFEVWTGLTLFTFSLLLFLAGWTALRGGPGDWVAVPAALLAVFGLLGLSGKVHLSGLLLNRGLAAAEPKRGGQVAVIYGASLFGLGIFGLSSLPYAWLMPSGSYGLAALLSSVLILGGLYVVGSTPILESHGADFEADRKPEPDPGPRWFELEGDDEFANETQEAEPLFAPPDGIPTYAVPQVRSIASAKRPALLVPEDIIAYAIIEWDWLETPANYTCVQLSHVGMGKLVEDGDLVGINHAFVDHRWLLGKLVAAYHDQQVCIGFLEEAGGRWGIRRTEAERVEIEAVSIIGAVEWSMKPNAKSIQPADAVACHERGADANDAALSLSRQGRTG
jgi:hypothetical protein